MSAQNWSCIEFMMPTSGGADMSIHVQGMAGMNHTPFSRHWAFGLDPNLPHEVPRVTSSVVMGMAVVLPVNDGHILLTCP